MTERGAESLAVGRLMGGLSIVVVLACTAVAGCGRPPPQTSYYKLVPPPTNGTERGGVVLEVDELRADAAYDDPLIAYRPSPFELKYYNYHSWVASPGVLVGEYLRTALERTGRFGRVVGEPVAGSAAELGGRLTAFEEVDETEARWLGHVALELYLKDARTGELLWTAQYDEAEPLEERNPAGLAAALSRAMARIVSKSAPEIAAAASVAAAKRRSVESRLER